MTTNEKTMTLGFIIILVAIVAAEETLSTWCLLLFFIGESVVLLGIVKQFLARDREIYAEQLDIKDEDKL